MGVNCSAAAMRIAFVGESSRRQTRRATDASGWNFDPRWFCFAQFGLELTSCGRVQRFPITGLENVAADDGDWIETAQGISRISPDARWLAIYRAFGTVLHVYRLPGIELVARLTNQVSIAGVSFSPLQDEVAIASRGQVKFWSTTSWERTRTATNFIGIAVIGMLFEPDGRSIWLAKDFRSAGLYESRTLEPRLLLPTGMFPLALDAGGRYLAVSVDAQRLQVWDLVAVRGQLRELGLDWKDR
jgi:hypothetical protein